jgi:ketosteroid isomerase-like protein
VPTDRLQIVRDCYEAYASDDRSLIEPHLADDLMFFSPPDPGIDLTTYWERCWPNAGRTSAFEFARLTEMGDEVLVTYEATRADGGRFRNTEVLTFAGHRINRIEVYFGWDL